MKWFKFTVAVLVVAVLTSSCSTIKEEDALLMLENELLILETALQEGIATKTDDCELIALLEFYARGAEDFSQPSGAENIASKLKNYTQDVSNLSESNPNLGPEYFNDLTFVIEKISSTDFAARFLEEVGRTYFPDCDYYPIPEVPTLPQKKTPLVENPMTMDRNEEACNIYYEAIAQASQLPWTSPKISYILKNGRIQAMKYADDDLALNLQILIDGGPDSTGATVDIAKICGQYR